MVNKIQASCDPSSRLVLLAMLTSSHIVYLFAPRWSLANRTPYWCLNPSIDWICCSMLSSNSVMHCLSLCKLWLWCLLSDEVDAVIHFIKLLLKSVKSDYKFGSNICNNVGNFWPGSIVPVKLVFNHSLYSLKHSGRNLFGTGSSNTFRDCHILSMSSANAIRPFSWSVQNILYLRSGAALVSLLVSLGLDQEHMV